MFKLNIEKIVKKHIIRNKKIIQKLQKENSYFKKLLLTNESKMPKKNKKLYWSTNGMYFK